MEAFEQYVRLVDSPENRALPEAERLPMVAGWDMFGETWRRKDTDNVSVVGYECSIEWEYVYPDYAEPCDLQAASGVLAEWLGDDEYAIGQHKGRWYVCHPKLKSSVDGPTMLAAQVAAAGAVLGVKHQSSSA